jgi:hypothetical protein
MDGVGGQLHAPAAVAPVPIIQKAGRAPGPVWTGVEYPFPHWDSIPGPSSP